MTLVAYHGKKNLKVSTIKRVEGHYRLDEIVKGQYWRDGKGCCVSCICHADDNSPHAKLSKYMGIPEWLARVIDGIFEGMPNGDAQQFPLRFVEAVPVGFSDWDGLKADFLHWVLMDKEYGVINFAKSDTTKKAIKEVAKLYKTRCTDQKKWSYAANAASAADAASAAYAADAADAAYAASAAYAADAAYAAYAASAAYAAYAAYAASAASRSKARKAQADKLISLLVEAQ